MCAAAHSYNVPAIRRPICRRFGTEPESTGSGPNQGSGRFGYYFINLLCFLSSFFSVWCNKTRVTITYSYATKWEEQIQKV